MATKLAELKLKNAVSDESSEEDEKETGNELEISLEKLGLGPKKKLLVLAFGGFLVHRAHRREYRNLPTNLRPDAVFVNFRVYKRPFLDGFLQFCFERFEVGLWTSAKELNVDGYVLSSIMGKYASRLVFVWHQYHCTDSGFKSLENKEKEIFLKELDKLWKQKGQYSASNTLMIDHEPYTSLINPPNTAIFPDKYSPENVGDKFLGPDGELRVFLDGLVDAVNVPGYLKHHPFGQPPITPSHPYWDYYSKIVRRFRK